MSTVIVIAVVLAVLALCAGALYTRLYLRVYPGALNSSVTSFGKHLISGFVSVRSHLGRLFCCRKRSSVVVVSLDRSDVAEAYRLSQLNSDAQKKETEYGPPSTNESELLTSTNRFFESLLADRLVLLESELSEIVNAIALSERVVSERVREAQSAEKIRDGFMKEMEKYLSIDEVPGSVSSLEAGVLVCLNGSIGEVVRMDTSGMFWVRLLSAPRSSQILVSNPLPLPAECQSMKKKLQEYDYLLLSFQEEVKSAERVVSDLRMKYEDIRSDITRIKQGSNNNTLSKPVPVSPPKIASPGPPLSRPAGPFLSAQKIPRAPTLTPRKTRPVDTTNPVESARSRQDFPTLDQLKSMGGSRIPSNVDSGGASERNHQQPINGTQSSFQDIADSLRKQQAEQAFNAAAFADQFRQQSAHKVISPPVLGREPDEGSWEGQTVATLKIEILNAMSEYLDKSLEERQKAFKHLCMRWHPDKCREVGDIGKRIFQFLQGARAWFLQE